MSTACSVVDEFRRYDTGCSAVNIANPFPRQRWKDETMDLQTLIFLAGAAQLCLVLASLMIPRILRWNEDTGNLRPLTRQVFWTYAGYIWCTNLFFGIVSVTMPADLVDGSRVSAALCTFIAIYWGARIAIQFAWFDRTDIPQGMRFVVAEWMLVGLFVALTAIYGYAAWTNIGRLG